MKTLLLAGVAALMLSAPAFADEQIDTLVDNGAWSALDHRASMTAATDLCIVVSEGPGPIHIGLRSDGTTFSVRVMDHAWTLPAHVDGSVLLATNGHAIVAPIDYNEVSTVDGAVSSDDVQELLDTLVQSRTLTVAIGNATWDVDLRESAAAINAFRTCAGIGGAPTVAIAAPGTNPFAPYNQQ
jgi:hypothetical protein